MGTNMPISLCWFAPDVLTTSCASTAGKQGMGKFAILPIDDALSSSSPTWVTMLNGLVGMLIHYVSCAVTLGNMFCQ